MLTLPPPVARGVQFDGTSYDALNLLGAKPSEALPGYRPVIPTLGTGVVSATGSSLDANSDKPWHPDSPLFWFGMLAAVTFGLIGASTTVRLGPFRGQLGAGRT
jgi:hypothetical protein